MGLIARNIEATGIASVCLSSAWSITASVNPPRAVFLDYPLGRTAGPPGDAKTQRRIALDALNAVVRSKRPGAFLRLPYAWPGGTDWKAKAMRPTENPESQGDSRSLRHAEPQYQCEADRLAAERRLAADGCPDCVFPGQDGSLRGSA